MTVDVSAAPVWRTLRTDRTSGVDDWSRADSGFLSNAGTKKDEVQLACAGARRHNRAPRGNVLCDTNFTFRAESSSRPPHTIVRRSSRDFVAARRTTSTASAGASLASATAKSRRSFRTWTSQDGRLSASRGLRTLLMAETRVCLLTTYSGLQGARPRPVSADNSSRSPARVTKSKHTNIILPSPAPSRPNLPPF